MPILPILGICENLENKIGKHQCKSLRIEGGIDIGVDVGVGRCERVLRRPGCAHGVCRGRGSPSLRSAVCDR